MWRVNQVDGVNGPFEENVLITDWNNEMPDFYLKQVKNVYGLTAEVKTSFHPGGKVFADGGAEYASGHLYSWADGSTHELGVKRHQYYIPYWYVYKKWIDAEKPYGNPLATDPDSTATITMNDLRKFKSEFDKEYTVAFQNHFEGISYGGSMKINGTQYPMSKDFLVRQGYSITAEALNQTYNGIHYFFDHWTDGYTTNPYDFYPNNNETYTAYFTGRPNQVQNVHFDCDIGEPIHIVWEQHTNSNCQYKIYRKTRDQYGHTTGPTLLATLAHSTTSYTDNQYMKAATYVFLLSYDVRAFYTIESTAADPHWISVYGESDIKYDSTGRVTSKLLSPCKRFTLGNYPNPFNPVTTIYYELARETSVRLAIYDLSGSRVKTVVEKTQPAGVYKIQWNGLNDAGNNVSSGIYFLRLESPFFRITRKLFLLR